LGLWDVLENCERKGRRSYKKSKKENDFQSLFKEFHIQKNIFNGKKVIGISLKIDRRHHLLMPSTSPANTMSFENKVKFGPLASRITYKYLS
jgi:G:T/U-mismatch repair DNA glycosylase